MIEAQRSSTTRILKQRDVAAGGAVRPAALELESAPSRPSAVASPASARCTTKEARLTVVEGGAHAVEIRCSCGEWTRVELQVENAPEVAR